VFVYITIFFIDLESLFDTEKSVQAEIISLILYHNSTFIITNLSKPAEISFVAGECHLNSEASLPPPPHHHQLPVSK
jgi:hypothetical protein